ncbi:hypothetical protein LOK49_Contig66G00001 [Camellia lanceoleosa]|nr:hypothetical protein LOK49_Contig66G00001 [Camellia lanceoleosa]
MVLFCANSGGTLFIPYFCEQCYFLSHLL